jgi:hypothetical protein
MVEALAAILILLIIASILIALGAKQRATAGLNRDLGNLRQIGQWTHAYAADADDRVPSLDEAPNSQWPILRAIPGLPEADASARHAVDIIRRRTGREAFPLPNNWIPNVFYSHLVLADHAGLPLPDRRFIATGDVHRMNWTASPETRHDFNHWQPYQQPEGGVPGEPVPNRDLRWPYSASFQLTPAWWDPGQSDWTSGLARTSSNSHNAYFTPNKLVIEGQHLSAAAFPSQKVMFHDYADWYHAQDARYFAATTESGASRVPMLIGDGGAAVRSTADANPGWSPTAPSSSYSARFIYQPRPWEPPTTTGEPIEPIFAGYYRWTRGGLKGRDFDGTEINTGQR